MLSHGIMILGTGCLLAAFFNRRKEQFLKQLFKDLNNCPKFHSDYLDDESHLPLNKHIILYGPVFSGSEKKIISPSFIRKSFEEDRFWKFELKDSFAYKTASNQLITVKSGPPVYGFNLPLTQRELKDQTYEERAIMHGIGVCVYGKVSNVEGKKIILPEILIGNKHESILIYLDSSIVKTGTRGKILVALGTIILGAHFAFNKHKRPKSNIEEQMESFKTSD